MDRARCTTCHRRDHRPGDHNAGHAFTTGPVPARDQLTAQASDLAAMYATASAHHLAANRAAELPKGQCREHGGRDLAACDPADCDTAALAAGFSVQLS